MSGPSGRISREPFADYDPDTSCWRTLQLSFEIPNLTESRIAWPKQGMSSRGLAYELPTSGHRICVSDCSLLPTPQAVDGHPSSPGRMNSAGHQSTLPGTVREMAQQ